MRMQQHLSVYVGCQSRKALHQLDDACESGQLLAVLEECSSHDMEKGVRFNTVQWETGDFNRCVQYYQMRTGLAC